MTEFTKYRIDDTKIREHLQGKLEKLNRLGDLVLEYTPFSIGEFYTYFPTNTSEEKLYQFKYGGAENGFFYDEAIEMVQENFKHLQDGVCIFDDCCSDFDPEENWSLFDQSGVHFDKEMYYLIKKEELSSGLLQDCFEASNGIWHSLIVLSDVSFERKKDQLITNLDLEKIAKSAKTIFFLAYDAEGYIIWERDPK